MNKRVFNYPPSLEVLKWLTPGSLKQNLAKAVRLWVILRSIYGDEADEVKVELEEEFTFAQWRNRFFKDVKIHHQRDNTPTLHDEECHCAKKLTEWLFAANLNIDKNEWCELFQKYYFIQPDELEKLLSSGIIKNLSEGKQREKKSIDDRNSNNYKSLAQGRLFAVTGKNLEYHFEQLVEMGWLTKATHQGKGNKNKFLKLDKLPDLLLVQPQEESEIISQQFTNEELSAFTNLLSQPINGIQRFFIHTEYIIHPQLYNRVELLQKQLKSLWMQDKVSLVKLTYQSAKQYQDIVNCIVYPVCIYYYQRAPYLFAYGQTPNQNGENSWSEIDWYDYRLDRIIKLNESLLDVDYVKIPQHFVNKCQGKYPPTPDDIKRKMSDAWGFDFYKPQELLLLRFDQYFYGNYIQGTERDEMFQKITRQQVEKLVKTYTASAFEEQKYLISTLQSRSQKDIYCKVNYRVNDNNILMRLRAWGPNVEVILPWDLRQRMAKDIEATYKHYK